MEITVENQRFHPTNLETEIPSVFDALYCEKNFNIYIRKNIRMCERDPFGLARNKETWKEFEQEKVNLKKGGERVGDDGVDGGGGVKFSELLGLGKSRSGWNPTRSVAKVDWLYEVKLPIVFRGGEVLGVEDYNVSKFYLRLFSKLGGEFWKAQGAFVSLDVSGDV